jgi:hypothetical protein
VGQIANLPAANRAAPIILRSLSRCFGRLAICPTTAKEALAIPLA